MKIIKMIDQNRRDFNALMKCEGCGMETSVRGYDDRNYHDNVMPDMKCEGCGKSRKDLGIEYPPTPTKYPSWLDV